MGRAVPDRGAPEPDDGVAPVYGLERHRRRTRGPDRTAHVGMAVFLGSWAMLFTGLFFAYAFVRARAPAWPPLEAPPLPRLVPGLNTLAIAASSAAVVRAVRQRELGRDRSAARLLAVAVALGAAFLALQGLVWGELWGAGLLPSSGPFGSVFYAFTAFHALHVFVGLAGLGAVAIRVRSRAGASPTDVRLWGWYWHFVGVLWVLLYVTLYLS